MIIVLVEIQCGSAPETFKGQPVLRSGQPESRLAPVRDPARFPWHEVTKVEHYWLEVNAMTPPMQLLHESSDYGGQR